MVNISNEIVPQVWTVYCLEMCSELEAVKQRDRSITGEETLKRTDLLTKNSSERKIDVKR